MLAVHPADKLFEALPQQFVVLDARPGRHRHDDQRHLPLVLRVRRQEPVKRLQTLDNPLRVIQPVDRQDHPPVSNRLADFLHFGLHLCIVRRVGVLLVVDPQRKGIHPHDSIVHADLAVRMLQAEDVRDATQEMTHVIVAVKSDQVGAEEPVQDVLPPGKKSEQLERRPWDVQEKTNIHVRDFVPQQPGQQQQLKIVHPHRVPRPRDFDQLVAEQVVHLLVRFPEHGLEYRPRRKIMKKRPDCLVAKPQVVLVDLPLGQKHRCAAACAQLLAQVLLVFRFEPLAGYAGPAHPEPFKILRQ